MFLSLEFGGGDKGVTLFARDLAGDDGFEPFRSSFPGWDSDRSRADRAVNACNHALGTERNKYISSLFNQFRWEGTTGWEYLFSKDYDKMLKHALVVAAALGLPLHVHKSFDDALLDAAEKAGIKLDFVAAKRVANPVRRDFEYTNRRLDNGEYVQLVDVVLPEGTPSIAVD